MLDFAKEVKSRLRIGSYGSFFTKFLGMYSEFALNLDSVWFEWRFVVLKWIICLFHDQFLHYPHRPEHFSLFNARMVLCLMNMNIKNRCPPGYMKNCSCRAVDDNLVHSYFRNFFVPLELPLSMFNHNLPLLFCFNHNSILSHCFSFNFFLLSRRIKIQMEQLVMTLW